MSSVSQRERWRGREREREREEKKKEGGGGRERERPIVRYRYRGGRLTHTKHIDPVHLLARAGHIQAGQPSQGIP